MILIPFEALQKKRENAQQHKTKTLKLKNKLNFINSDLKVY